MIIGGTKVGLPWLVGSCTTTSLFFVVYLYQPRPPVGQCAPNHSFQVVQNKLHINLKVWLLCRGSYFSSRFFDRHWTVFFRKSEIKRCQSKALMLQWPFYEIRRKMAMTNVGSPFGFWIEQTEQKLQTKHQLMTKRNYFFGFQWAPDIAACSFRQWNIEDNAFCTK